MIDLFSAWELQVILAASATGALLCGYAIDRLSRLRGERTPRLILAAAALSLILLTWSACNPITVTVQQPVYITESGVVMPEITPEIMRRVDQTLARIVKLAAQEK